MVIAAWIFSVAFGAQACEPLKARTPPELGRAKDGTADYKLINQSMGELLNAVRIGETTPDEFKASETAADWTGGPLKHGVLLIGPAPAGHALGSGEVRITVQRYPSGCVIHLKGTNGEWERYVAPGGFTDLFPWRGRGRLLESVVRGVLDNPSLVGWARYDPADPMGTRGLDQSAAGL